MTSNITTQVINHISFIYLAHIYMLQVTTESLTLTSGYFIYIYFSFSHTFSSTDYSYTMQSPKVIVVSDEPQSFNEEDWIEKGLQ